MFKSILFLSVISIFGALTALASIDGDDKPSDPKKAVVFEEMRDRCARIQGQYGDFRQIDAPKDIVITCSEMALDYVEGQAGAVPFSNRRWVSAQMTSNKFEVVTDTKEFQVAQQKAGTCPVYRQVKNTFTTDYQTTCADIVGYKGDAKDFCSQIVTAQKGKNPKLIRAEETGVYINTCAGAVPQHNGKPIY